MQKPGEGAPLHAPMFNLKSPNSLYTQRLAMTKFAPESTQKMPRRIRLSALTTTLLLAFTPFFAATAQERAQEKETKTTEKEKPSEPTPPPPKEESSVTEHSIKIGGQTIPYKAIAGTILLKNEKDEPQALIYSTTYARSDVKDLSQRPISFIYNGGPGSASLWLHMGAFGPKRVATVNAGVTPPAPYKLEDNPHCLLDKTDLVFIDPIGTGFSHAVGKSQDKD